MYHNGVYYLQSPDDKVDCCLVSVSADLSKNDKPVYLSIFMDKEQLQAIIDNEHLFDKSLVNSAYLLLSHYNSLKVAYPE